MTYFAWASDMSVGNTLLDHDHRELIALVNELHTATSRGEGRGVVGDILNRLLVYTQQHFQREEHHMERLQYPKTDEHKRLHQDLYEQVVALKARFDAGHITVAAQVSTLLRDGLSLHILREDKQFAAELTAAAPGTAQR